ncbi:hypothetical protein NA57DRAFT_71671 [Rhizodiscina lignyota]|uniref:Argonaute linker 1 domain-containing protein n=1 Tax=Rhizodiscina lignyota TaxID=1504668 RepID=A0A9P4MEK2_9PEZI|nr:hypothetical protein NA57DRAFT_71671 [Rhizodiscina lignyota]
MSALLANRGYFSSVRPGTSTMLINVNTVTSAFLRPILVSKFIARMKSAGCPPQLISKSLVGKSARITYQRLHHNPDTDPDPNAFRNVCITAIGKPVAKEVNYKKLQNDFKASPVLDYFKNTFSKQKTNKLDPEAPCVNVGYVPRDDKDEDRHKARWIPSDCLELLANQPFTHLLPSKLSNSMIARALQDPASNANLIMTE